MAQELYLNQIRPQFALPFSKHYQAVDSQNLLQVNHRSPNFKNNLRYPQKVINLNKAYSNQPESMDVDPSLQVLTTPSPTQTNKPHVYYRNYW